MTVNIPSYGFSGSMSLSPPGGTFNVSKAAGSLNWTGNTASLFPDFGINNALLAPGNALPNGLGFNLYFRNTDGPNSTLVGKTIPFNVSGISGTFQISSFSGKVVLVANNLDHPVADHYNHIWRGSAFTTYSGSIVFQGTASAFGQSAPATITVAPLISGVGGVAENGFVNTVSVPGVVATGLSHSGNVFLSSNSQNGDTISFTSVGPVSGLSNVSIASGSNTSPFSFTAGTVSAPTPATITASNGTSAASGTFVVQPVLFRINAASAKIYGGTTQTFVINFSEPAPGPFTISLHSDSPEVVLTSATVPVAAGKTYAIFTARVPVGATTFTLDATDGSTVLVQSFTPL